METSETSEKIEKIEKTGIEEEKNCFERICENKNDHIAIYDISNVLQTYENKLISLKNDLISVRESGNISVRETQKVLTVLCKTIHNINLFASYLNETAYNVEHSGEINAEKRALREMIKSATPDDMAKFREFIKESKLKESAEETYEKIEELDSILKEEEK